MAKTIFFAGGRNLVRRHVGCDDSVVLANGDGRELRTGLGNADEYVHDDTLLRWEFRLTGLLLALVCLHNDTPSKVDPGGDAALGFAGVNYVYQTTRLEEVLAVGRMLHNVLVVLRE